MDNVLKVEMQSDTSFKASADIERSIFDLDTQIDMLSSHADNLDCLVAIASGLLCGMLDVLWVEVFDLSEGKSIVNHGDKMYKRGCGYFLGPLSCN